MFRSFVCSFDKIDKGLGVVCEHVFEVSKMKLCLLRIIQLFPSYGGLLHVASFKKNLQVSKWW